MEVFDTLTAVSEVSIALAGFGGIAAGLGYRASGSWHGDDLFRLLVMVIVCLSVVFACFVPTALHSLDLDGSWRLAGGFVLITSIGQLTVQYRRFRRGLPPGYNLVVTLALIVSNLIVFGLSVFLVLGLPESNQAPGVYLTAILFLLLTPAILFVRLIVTAFASIHDADDV